MNYIVEGITTAAHPRPPARVTQHRVLRTCGDADDPVRVLRISGLGLGFRV